MASSVTITWDDDSAVGQFTELCANLSAAGYLTGGRADALMGLLLAARLGPGVLAESEERPPAFFDEHDLAAIARHEADKD